MKHLLLSGLALGLAGTVSAQTTTGYVLPAGSQSTNTNQYEYLLIAGPSRLPIHHQAIYNSSEFTKPSGALLSIAYRRNNYYGNSMPAGTTTLTITIGYSNNAASAASTTFANNLAVNPKVFYKGTMNWPSAAKGTGPAPFTHVVKPAAPFVFLPVSVTNGSVCVDSVITASTFANSTYTIDSATPDLGLRSTNGSVNSNCKFSNNNYNSGLGYTTGGLTPAGGTWYVQYSNLLPNAPGLAFIGLNGSNKPGAWPLPIDMTGLGAPGCHWDVSLDVGPFVMNADANGRAKWPNITIPPGLGGASFFDQGLWLDSAANAGGLVAGWSSEWYIGTGKGPRGATIYRTTDTGNSPTGFRSANEEVVICEFTY